MTAARNHTLQSLIAEIHGLPQTKQSLGFIAFGVVLLSKILYFATYYQTKLIL